MSFAGFKSNSNFKEGVGFAHSKCGQCDCSFEDMQIYFDEDNFEERTFERHVQQCSEIEKANTEYLRSSLKTTWKKQKKQTY